MCDTFTMGTPEPEPWKPLWKTWYPPRLSEPETEIWLKKMEDLHSLKDCTVNGDGKTFICPAAVSSIPIRPASYEDKTDDKDLQFRLWKEDVTLWKSNNILRGKNVYFRLDDCPWLKDIFENVDGDIWAFCAINYREVAWDSLDERTQKLFTDWAPSAQKLFGYRDGPVYFFKSWMWRVLAQSVLSYDKSDKVTWTTPYYQKMHEMQQILLAADPNKPNKNPDAWHHWKWETTALFTTLTVDQTKVTRERIQRSCVYDILQAELQGHLPPRMEELSKGSQRVMENLSRRVCMMEFDLNTSMLDWNLDFCHPLTKEAHSFKFQYRVDDKNTVPAMCDCFWSGFERYGSYYHNPKKEKKGFAYITGMPVDLVIRPRLEFRNPQVWEHKHVNFYRPMIVWVFEWNKEMVDKMEIVESWSSGEGGDLSSDEDLGWGFYEDENEKPDGDETGRPDGNETGRPDGDETGRPDGNETGRPDGNETGRPDGDETGRPDGDEN
ncbi:hypothetical protein BGZ63DRAFT_464255 [Mariannaea sp. PMI_226]|nr:hypothetical protein BGZ63DRAFT_464255 [Mariannaea sp. PMI_226]